MDDRPVDEVSRVLPQLRIDELLDELQSRLAAVRSSRDRVRHLLEAVVAIASALDLEAALSRIVQAAASLVDAEYGALGVLDGGKDRPARFVTVGLAGERIHEIGADPRGHRSEAGQSEGVQSKGDGPEGDGLLEELIRTLEPWRGDGPTGHPGSSGFPPNPPSNRPPGRQPMSAFLGVPIRVRGDVFGNLYLTGKKGGAPFDADDEAVLAALAAAAGVAIDNARLYEEARRREQWLEATNELTRGLLSGQTVEEVLAAFVRRVRTIAQADLAVVGLPDAEADAIVVVAADGADADRMRGAALAIEDSLLGSVFRAGRTETVADAAADARTRTEVAPDTPLGPAVLVPLGAAGQARGVLAVARRRGGAPFDEAVLSLVSALAVQAAVGLELAERRRDSEMLSLYADRDRIGRDLHDLAIQRLFATSMSLQGAYKITQKPEVAKRVAQAITDLDDTIKVIRSTIFALHAHELEHQRAPGVRAQVIESCERVAEQLGFNPSVRFTGPVDTLVAQEVGEQLVAVLREALSNAARHARASRVAVEVAADGTRIELTVADDGVGIPEGVERSGLANLDERARQFGGRFRAEPGPDGGTVVTWSVPVREDDQDG